MIDTVRPFLSNHFNLTVELPLKAIVRGHSYAIVPITWTGRSAGTSKLKLQEMGSRYLFIVLYVFLEDHLSRGDYRRPQGAPAPHPPEQGTPWTIPGSRARPACPPPACTARTSRTRSMAESPLAWGPRMTALVCASRAGAITSVCSAASGSCPPRLAALPLAAQLRGAAERNRDARDRRPGAAAGGGGSLTD